MATTPIDFSSIGGKPVQQAPIDFSSIGGKPIQADAGQSTKVSGDSGIWAGIKRNTVDMVAGLYHAFTDPATPQEKAQLQQKVNEERAWQIQHGYDPREVPDSLWQNPSTATLAWHRIIDAPAQVLHQKGSDEQAAAAQLLAHGATWKGANLYASGAADKLLSAVPMVGPWLNSVAERTEKGDYSGAATDLIAAKLYQKSPALVKGAVQKIAPSLAGRLYESALKPPASWYSPEEAATIAKTGIEKGIPVSPDGVDKLGTLIEDANTKIKDTIAQNPNAPINKYAVASRLQQPAVKFAIQVNPEADLSAISQSGNEFLRNQPTTIPASQAQALKQGTYRALGEKSYGELQTASVESQKALARGLKEEIAKQFPEINDLNADEGRMINLYEALQRAVRRISNHQLIGLGTPMVTGAAGAVTGSRGIAAVAGVLKAVLDDPYVKSKIAISLGRKGIGPASAVRRLAGYSAALGDVANISAQSTGQDQKGNAQ